MFNDFTTPSWFVTACVIAVVLVSYVVLKYPRRLKDETQIQKRQGS